MVNLVDQLVIDEAFLEADRRKDAACSHDPPAAFEDHHVNFAARRGRAARKTRNPAVDPFLQRVVVVRQIGHAAAGDSREGAQLTVIFRPDRTNERNAHESLAPGFGMSPAATRKSSSAESRARSSRLSSFTNSFDE